MAKGFSGGRGDSSSGGSRRAGSHSGSGRGGSSSPSSTSGIGSRGGVSSAGSTSRGSSPAQRAANTRMWTQPATTAQIAALQAHGNYDGKYYSKGRAGQAIAEAARASGSTQTTRTTSSDVEPARPNYTMSKESRDPLAALTTRLSELQQTLNSEHGEYGVDAAIYGDVLSHDDPEVDEMAGMQMEPLQASMPASALPFGFLADLEDRHLRTYQSEYGTYAPSAVLNLRRQWVNLKTNYARTWAQARVDLREILREAPIGTFSSPEQTADWLLASAINSDLEERHLRTYLSQYGKYAPDAVLHLIMQSLTERIEAAKTVARGQVDVAKTLAPQPPPAPATLSPAPKAAGVASAVRAVHAPSQRTNIGTKSSSSTERSRTPATGRVGGQFHGTVVSIKSPHGATVSLKPGLIGWLHISKLRPLNDGNFVETVESVLHVGQRIHVRVIGFNDNGRPRLALAGPKDAAQQSRGEHSTMVESGAEAAPTAVSPKRGFRAWFTKTR